MNPRYNAVHFSRSRCFTDLHHALLNFIVKHINGGMSVYKDLLAQKKKERQQLPITMFFSPKNTPAPQALEEKKRHRAESGCSGSVKQQWNTVLYTSVTICPTVLCIFFHNHFSFSPVPIRHGGAVLIPTILTLHFVLMIKIITYLFITILFYSKVQ